MKKLLLTLIYPLLLLNITGSDGLTALNVFPVGLIFYWLAIGCSFLAVAITFKNMLLNVVLAAFMIFFWVLDLMFENTIVFFLHILSTSMLFAIVAILMAIEYPRILKAQMSIFLFLSIPIMVLQITGVSEDVQVLNTLFYEHDGEGDGFQNIVLTPVLFRGVDEFIYNSAQGRPPGLFYSNAILSPILLGISAFFLGTLKKRSYHFTDFLMSMAIVLVMSKISFIVFFLLIFLAKRFSPSEMKGRVNTILLVTVFLYFLYWVFFPGLFVNNLSLTAFYSSSYYRLIDVYIYFVNNSDERDRLISLMSSELSFHYADENDIGGLTGISKVIEFSPVIIILFFLLRSKLIRAWRVSLNLSSQLTLLSILMMLTIIISSFASSLFKAPIFGYYAGIAFLPVAMILFPKIVGIFKSRSQTKTFPKKIY